MKDNFVIKWLKNYFKNDRINEKDIKSVLHFSLLWNFFESEYFTEENKLSPENLILLCRISLAALDPDIINKKFNYFKKRYFTEGDTNGLFDSLNLSTNRSRALGENYKDFCKDTIVNITPTLERQLIVLFLIIHRYRNNLFHGRKQTKTLNLYKPQFKIINTFLIEYFNSTVQNNAINKNRF